MCRYVELIATVSSATDATVESDFSAVNSIEREESLLRQVYAGPVSANQDTV
jgi:hypothetical protein